MQEKRGIKQPCYSARNIEDAIKHPGGYPPDTLLADSLLCLDHVACFLHTCTVIYNNIFNVYILNFRHL